MKLILLVLFSLIAGVPLFAGGTDTEAAALPEREIGLKIPDEAVPVLTVFHETGRNALGILTWNCGFHFPAAAVITLGFVKNGWDWGWYKIVWGNRALAAYGMAANITGYAAPFLFPALAYSIGRWAVKDKKLQVAGLALAQSLLFSFSMNTLFKGITGRRQAGVYDLDPETADYSGEFHWGFFTQGGVRDGVIDGWPSGHTMSAVAAAAALSEIYHDNIWIQLGAYSYAAIIGAGMTFCDHWVSDIICGALFGYVIGKVTGKSFARLLKPGTAEEKLSLYIIPGSIGITMHF